MGDRSVIAVTVGLLLVTSGCVGAPGAWDLYADASVEERSEEYAFHAEVFLSGNYGGVELRDIRLVLLDEQNESITTVSVGTLNSSRPEATRNVSLAEQPAFVVIEVGERSIPDETRYSIPSGLRRTDGGSYVAVQSTPVYNSSS